MIPDAISHQWANCLNWAIIARINIVSKKKKSVKVGKDCKTKQLRWWRRHWKFLVTTAVALIASGWSIRFFTIKTTGGSTVCQIGGANTYIENLSSMSIENLDTNVVCNIFRGLLKNEISTVEHGDNNPMQFIAQILSGEYEKFDYANPTNQYAMALFYINGIGTKIDYEKAAKWMTLASEQNLNSAQHALAIMYDHGLGVNKDEVMATKLYIRSAENDYITAMHNVGVRYLLGQGVGRDYKKAFEYLDRAFQRGYIPSCGVLGDMYLKGDGVEKDELRGFVMIQAAADKFNSPLAQHLLARMYLDGEYVKQDVETGMSYMRKSADQGFPTAQYDLSQLYKEGRFVPKSDALSLVWLQRAEASVQDGILKCKVNISSGD